MRALRTMSSISVASLRHMEAAKLAETLRQEHANGVAPADSRVAVVDVRDSDHIGGHIRHSHHVPSPTVEAMLPTLLRKLADKPVVVFHCALSQQRGPSAAVKYLRAREDQAKRGAALKDQTVYVLDGGFNEWQRKYGPDEALTEAWRKEIWQDGY